MEHVAGEPLAWGGPGWAAATVVATAALLVAWWPRAVEFRKRMLQRRRRTTAAAVAATRASSTPVWPYVTTVAVDDDDGDHGAAAAAADGMAAAAAMLFAAAAATVASAADVEALAAAAVVAAGRPEGAGPAPHRPTMSVATALTAATTATTTTPPHKMQATCLDDTLRDVARALFVELPPLPTPVPSPPSPPTEPGAAARPLALLGRTASSGAATRTRTRSDDNEDSDLLRQLPTEIVLRILLYLDQADLAVCAQVHPAWAAVVRHGGVWRVARCTLNRDTAVSWARFLHAGWRRIRTLELLDATDEPTPDLNNPGAYKYVRHLTVKASVQHEAVTFTWPRINTMLQQMVAVEELHIKGLTITDTDLAAALLSLPRPQQLHTLAIDQCVAGLGSVAERAISPVGPRTVNVLRSLPIRALSLEACPRLFDWSIGTFLQALPGLQSLQLRLCTRLTDRGLSHIATALPHLKEINLHGIPSITDDGIALLVTRCTGLESVNVTSCTLLTDASLEAIAALPRLHSLWCGLCSRLTGATLRILGAPRAVPWRTLVLDGLRLYECPDHLALEHVRTLSLANIATSKLFPTIVRQLTTASMPHLETLVVTGCEWLADDGVRAFALTAGRALRTVDLSGNPDMGDAAVKALAASCPFVTSLTLISCHRVTDQAIRAVTDRMRWLETLKVSNCSQLTDAALEGIATLPRLRHLNVYLCKNLSSTALRRLQARKPRLIVVS